MPNNRESDPSPFPPSHKPSSGKPALATRSASTVLNDLAGVVAEAYVEERLRWVRERGLRESKRYSVEKDMPAFRALAKLFVHNQIADYRTYLHAQFEARANKNIAPTPRQCAGPVAEQKWQRFTTGRPEIVAQLSIALQIQKKTFSTALILEEDRATYADPPWTREQIVSAVLWSETVQLSSLFRYGAACAAKLKKVAATHREAAFLQYLFARKAYDQVWKDMVPASLREAADTAMLDLAQATEATRGKK